jgi:hypothetical protein
MENKQTERVTDASKTMSSIEWFNQQIIDRQNGEGDSRNWDMILQQAKEKHKQEIEKAYNKGWHEGWLDDIRKKPKSSEQYYNETFNPKNNG